MHGPSPTATIVVPGFAIQRGAIVVSEPESWLSGYELISNRKVGLPQY